MLDIYANTFLCISAASASAVTEGFLHDRPATLSDATIPILHTTRDQIGAFGLLGIVPNRWRDPIDGRAWCMQEMVLPPRALVYAYHTLQFCCRHLTVNVGDGFSTSLSHVVRLPPPTARNRSFFPSTFASAWRKVVMEYTSRWITYSSNRLIALGGISQDFHRISGYRYLCGLWEENLTCDMLWSTSSPTDRPHQYAPSWAWSSVESPVVVNSLAEYYDAGAEILGCEIVLEDEALPYGNVISGSIILNAPLTVVLVRRLYDFPPDIPRDLENPVPSANLCVFVNASHKLTASSNYWRVPYLRVSVCLTHALLVSICRTYDGADQIYTGLAQLDSSEDEAVLLGGGGC